MERLAGLLVHAVFELRKTE